MGVGAQVQVEDPELLVRVGQQLLVTTVWRGCAALAEAVLLLAAGEDTEVTVWRCVAPVGSSEADSGAARPGWQQRVVERLVDVEAAGWWHCWRGAVRGWACAAACGGGGGGAHGSGGWRAEGGVLPELRNNNLHVEIMTFSTPTHR